MRRTTPPGTLSPRNLVAVIGGGTLLLLLVGIGVYGLLRGPGPEPAPRNPAAETPARQTPGLDPEPVAETSDAERFARDVATRLFAWDTATGRLPVEYMQPIVDRTDVDEAPGLTADLRGYFPDDETWRDLREFSTRQWLDIDTIDIPASWASIVEQTQSGLLPPGATAYTITGNRHRAGVWDGKDVSDVRPVSFTTFLACPPDEDCRLLRVSGVDQPLR